MHLSEFDTLVVTTLGVREHMVNVDEILKSTSFKMASGTSLKSPTSVRLEVELKNSLERLLRKQLVERASHHNGSKWNLTAAGYEVYDALTSDKNE